MDSPVTASAASPNPGMSRVGLDEVVARSSIIICCGSGGVGKTTTAAVIALEAARAGRRACVVTIDPARRLADALGLGRGGLSNTPLRIEGVGADGGGLWAMMLDAKGTFDALVVKHAADPAQAERILANRFYRNISGALSGTQEYMAAEKLYELHEEHDFDLVVVDTPPTRNALDFLDAPERLRRFLDHRLYRILMAPTRGIVKAVNVAAQAFLRSITKVVGGEAIGDAIAFFSAFEGMEEGFKERARHVNALLADDRTAFVLVASPKADTVEEATFFTERLHDGGLAVRALVVNRMHPAFPPGDTAQARAGVERFRGTPLEAPYRALAEVREMAEAEERNLSGLAARIAPAPVVRVPLLGDDVHDLGSLGTIGTHLFTSPR